MPNTEPVTRLAMKKLRKPPSFMKPMITWPASTGRIRYSNRAAPPKMASMVPPPRYSRMGVMRSPSSVSRVPSTNIKASAPTMPSGSEPFQPEKSTQVASPRKIIMGMPAICRSPNSAIRVCGVERFFIVMLQRVVWRHSSYLSHPCRLACLQRHIKTLNS